MTLRSALVKLAGILTPLIWLTVSYILAQLFVGVVFVGLARIGVPFRDFNETIVNASLAAAVYVFTLTLVLILPKYVTKTVTTLKAVGLQRLPTWKDAGLAVCGFLAYFLLSIIIMLAVKLLAPSASLDAAQTTGFETITHHYEYMLAFLTLVVVAPVAEELLFRGYLYERLRRSVRIVTAVTLTSALFAVFHGQLNVGLDVFALSVVACSLREFTGSVWASIFLHVIKNGLAFYLLFINPALLNIM